MPKKKWEQIDDDYYYDEEGNIKEFSCNSNTPMPRDIEVIYVYWNELIGLVRLYFKNPDDQDISINDIYIEIIMYVEGILRKNVHSSLREKYKRPFQNIIGCEFKIKKREAMKSLFNFLGDINEVLFSTKQTEESTPKVKKENPKLFEKIDSYIKNHSLLPQDSQNKEEEPQVTKDDDILQSYVYGNLETLIEKGSLQPRFVKNNGSSLYVSKNKLRREDLIVIASLIMAKGGQVASGLLIERMGHEDDEKNQPKLHRSIDRLRRFGEIYNIKNKRGEGYYLE